MIAERDLLHCGNAARHAILPWEMTMFLIFLSRNRSSNGMNDLHAELYGD